MNIELLILSLLNQLLSAKIYIGGFVAHLLVIKVLDIPYSNNLYRISALDKLVIILVSEQAGKIICGKYSYSN